MRVLLNEKLSDAKRKARLKKLRQLKKKIWMAKIDGYRITIQDIADSLNLPRSYVNEILNSTTTASDDKIRMLEDAIKKLIP